MIINALNSGADAFMADLEDSTYQIILRLRDGLRVVIVDCVYRLGGNMKIFMKGN